MTCRKLSAFALAVALTVLSCVPAWAGETVKPPSQSDFDAALAAARTPAAMSYARTNFRQVAGAEPAAVTIADRGVAVYMLNPDFVRDVPDAPVGIVQYIAVTATADTGVRATLRASPEGADNAWTVGSVFSGDDEETLSRDLAPGSVLLNEPQINGWYALTATGVTLLRASFPQSEVGQSVSLDEYGKQVRARYRAHLPEAAPTTEAERGPSTVGLLVAGCVVLLVFVLVFGRSRRHSQRKSTPTSDGARLSK
ncbi:hypothetical protein GCM10022243_33970 [Saccharothrix violaceirubra]|uniref:LPXTG-motif cell wall-anchored protein n=1 Tax=Saccharothrix violaceirubra TaxID=413306 RepID=A0A7W7WWU6_9PSEU|nr:hypothetical protein [Saccharothrix violaceirubra]MBB4966451.1 hypothetical protein [Saccharothrix violaceirubra]